MDHLDKRDYFTDHDVALDPYAYFEAVREHGPVHRLEDRGLLIVTGYDECLQISLDTENFSCAVTTAGPTCKLPFEPEGDDVSDQIEAHRAEIPLHDQVTSLDGDTHHKARALLNKLFVPSRLKANEEYMVDVAERMVEEVVAKRGCEVIGELATPFVTMVIADLLGVPEEDREKFREAIDNAPPPFSLDSEDQSEMVENSFMQMGAYFYGYVADRRETPRADILTEISRATYPDGSIPETIELVKILMFLFGAGQDTSAKLLGNAVRYLAEHSEMQDRLRRDRALIPAFLEEMLRLEGSTKITSRIARKRTVVGGVEVPAGQIVVLAIAAGNRDPERWEAPSEFRLKRPKATEHLAFGRGAHVCIGAPLARAEVRVFIDRLLAKTSAIRLSEKRHGPPSARSLSYEPSFVIRGLADLQVELEPA